MLEIGEPTKGRLFVNLVGLLVVAFGTAIAGFLDRTSLFFMIPLCGVLVIETLRVLRREGVDFEIRSDGLLTRSLAFGDELFVPWSSVGEVVATDTALDFVTLEIDDLSQTYMDAGYPRIVESAILGTFYKNRIAVHIPHGSGQLAFRDLLEAKVIRAAREDLGLLDEVGRENTL